MKTHNVWSVLTGLLFMAGICTQTFAFEEVNFVKDLTAGLERPVDVAVSDSGEIFVLDKEKAQVFVYTSEGKAMSAFGGVGTENGKLLKPSALAIAQSGNLVVADTGNSRVQVFNEKGRFLFALGNAGSNRGEFINPVGVAVDQHDFIYVADSSKKTISKFSPRGVFLEEKKLHNSPLDIEIDLEQNMYVLMSEDGNIMKKSLNKGITKNIHFKHEGDNILNFAVNMAVDMRGDIYFIEKKNHSIKKIGQDEKLLFSFGSKGSGKGQFNRAAGITADQKGRIYIADTKNKRVQIFEITGSHKNQLRAVQRRDPAIDFEMAIDAQNTIVDLNFVPGKGLYALSDYDGHILFKELSSLIFENLRNNDYKLKNPKALFVSRDGKILVTDTGNHRLQFLNDDGAYEYHFGRKGNRNSEFNALQGVAINEAGYIYVADTLNNRIQVFNSDGIYLKSFGGRSQDLEGTGPEKGKFHQPKDLLFDSRGNLHVLDSKNKRIQVFNDEGKFLFDIGENGKKHARFVDPVDIAIDEKDYLYVADRGEHKIKILDSDGQLVMSFGSDGAGPSYFPKLSAVSALHGKIYVSDYKLNKIKVFAYDPNGVKIKTHDKTEETNKVTSQEKTSESSRLAKQLHHKLNKVKLKPVNQTYESIESKPQPAAQVAKEPIEKVVKKPAVAEETNAYPIKRTSARAQPQILNEDNVQYTAEFKDDFLYVTTFSFPMHSDHIASRDLKYLETRKATLQLAKKKLSEKIGIPVDNLKNYISVEKEEVMDNGQLKITISVPKNILFRSVGPAKLGRK